MASKGVTNEGQKIALLLHSGGMELQEIYYTLVPADTETTFKHEATLYKEASLGSPWLICQSTLTSADQIQYGGRVHHKKGKWSAEMSVFFVHLSWPIIYNNQMYSKTVLFKVTILLDESLIEEMRGWLTINCGEIVKVEKPRNKNKPVPGKTALSRTLLLIKLSTQY